MKKLLLIFYVIGLLFCASASAQQPSVVVDGLRYEKIAEGKAKLVEIADYAECTEAILRNDSTLYIPDFVCIDNDSLRVAVIAPNSIKNFYNVMELWWYESLSISLPAYLEELGYNFVTGILNVKNLIVRSYYPPVTNTVSLFAEDISDPFASGIYFKLNKITIPSGATHLYSSAPGWRCYKWAEEGMEECDSLPIIKSDRFIEAAGYVGVANSVDKAEMTLLYKLQAENETEIEIPSHIESNGANYTVTVLGEEMFALTRYKKIYVPSSVKRLEDFVFLGSNCEEITGMEGVESVGGCPFGTVSLRKLTIPESFTRLTAFSFHFGRYTGCLDELTLPSTLTEIEDYCIHNVTLKKVISKNPVAPVAGYDIFERYAFEYLGDLIVPEGSEESYLAQPGWRRFARINGVKYADYVTPLYDQATVRANGRAISIATASEVNYEIYSSAGVKVAAGKASNDLDIALDTPGVYVVKIAQTSSSAAPLTTKIAIR